MGGTLYQLLNHNSGLDHDRSSVANSTHINTNLLDPKNSSLMRHTRLTISR